jgi:hypothetical protein
MRSKYLKKANANINFALIPLEINLNMLRQNGFSYYALGLLVLGSKLIEFLEFNNKKPLEAIEEALKPNLLTTRVYKINNKGNEIRENLKTLTKQRKYLRGDDISFPKSIAIKKRVLKKQDYTKRGRLIKTNSKAKDKAIKTKATK